jgi:carbamoylphosphate synthase small subunit
MNTTRGLVISIIAVASLVLAVAYPALADIGDISVGGVWVCRITRGAGGVTLEQRLVQIERQMTEVLSIPGIDRRTITVSVRPFGRSAAIVVADITVITVTSEDAAGTSVTTMELARQWARRLVAGLQRALPSATFHGF